MEVCLDGKTMGTGLVVALRPPFKRLNTSINNSLRRRGSFKHCRRPLSATDVLPQCDQNGNAKCGNTEGPAVWASSFEKLLEDPYGLQAFAEFLKKEFSAENIYFWTACERYRKLPPGSERIAEALRIYQQHLNVGAPEAVNVDSHGRQCAEQSLNTPNSDVFDQAQKQIFNLMKFDSYPRFLKSEIYKQCLSGKVERQPLDNRLLLHYPGPSSPSKLKKSLSNAEDRRRKSLLRWHRKNRTKSRDRTETEPTMTRCDIKNGEDNTSTLPNGLGGGEIHSSRSSLASLDLAVANQDISVPIADIANEKRTSLCRVSLSNGSTTVVQIRTGETIQQLVTRLLDKRGLCYSSFEVFTNKHSKAIDINEPSTKLAGCEVTVEQRVVFKLDLPNRKIISVKSKYTKIIIDVLRPILHKYQYNLDQVTVSYDNLPIDMLQPVTAIDGARLNIQLKKELVANNLVVKVDNVKVKLDELTNKVFEGILQEKSDNGAFKPAKSDKGSVKSEDWGSEHSSGIFGRFLRRDSAVYEKKKRAMALRPANNGKPSLSNANSEDSGDNAMRKPLIAKWKAGASKFHINTCDDFVEGLTRAQRRLEDQRGTEINFELPDFLKDKENGPQALPTHLKTNPTPKSNFFLHGPHDSRSPQTEQSVSIASAKTVPLELQANYENRNVLVSNIDVQNKSESDKSEPNSPEKSLIPSDVKGRRSIEPPPLPPKPKIVPIKPPNWGFYKSKELSTDRSQTMFLEQPSSSFV